MSGIRDFPYVPCARATSYARIILHHSKFEQPMSALGQKQTSGHAGIMSALPPKADIDQHGRDVRYVPKADIQRCGKSRWMTPGRLRDNAPVM